MGDTGSLALGGGVGTVAVIAKHELLLVLVGGVFVHRGPLGDHPGGSRSSSRASASSGWPRSTTTSSCWAGPSRRSSSASGSSRSSSRCSPEHAQAAMTRRRSFAAPSGAARGSRGARAWPGRGRGASCCCRRGARGGGRPTGDRRRARRCGAVAVGAGGLELRLEPRAAARTRATGSTPSWSRPGWRWTTRCSSAARAAGVRVVGEIELAYRFLAGAAARRDRHERQEHRTTALAGALLEAAGIPVERRRQHRQPAHRDVVDARRDAPCVVEVIELPARVDRELPAAHRGAAQPHRGPPRPLPDVRGLPAPPSCAIFENQGAGDVLVLNADDPLVGGAPAPRARGGRFSMRRSPPRSRRRPG